MKIDNKYLPYLIFLNFIFLINGCDPDQYNNLINPQTGLDNYVHIDYYPPVVKDTESFNLIIKYKISSNTSLSL